MRGEYGSGGAVARRQHATQAVVAQQWATVVAIDGVSAGMDVIPSAGPLLPDAKEPDAGNLQAGPGVLLDKVLTGGAA